MTNMFDYNLYERKETSDGYDYYVPHDIRKATESLGLTDLESKGE